LLGCLWLFGGGGGGRVTKNVQESLPTTSNSLPQIDKLKSNAMTLIYFICLLQRP